MKRITTIAPLLFFLCLSVSAADQKELTAVVKEHGGHSIVVKRLPMEPSPMASDFELFADKVLSELKQALEYFDLKGSAVISFDMQTTEMRRVHVKIDFEDPEVDSKMLESALPEPADMELPAKNLARRILGSIFSCMES
jgi:hypothetical protein